MATKIRVTYTDGRSSDVLASARAQVETERHFKGADNAGKNRIEASFYLAWASLRYAGKETAEFEQWLDTVEDAEEVEKTAADENATDPTPAVPEPTGSSN